MEILAEEQTVYRVPVELRESSAACQAWQEAADIYRKGIPELSYRLGDTPEDYARLLSNAARVGEARVRTYLYEMARRDWARFAASGNDSRLAPLDLVQYVDIRKAGEMWITVSHYPRHEIVTHNKPVNIADALDKMRAVGWTIRNYGARWYRAWPGRPTPVRTAEEVKRARQEIVNGTFYIPEDFNLPPGQVDLAFDL
ncbi:MAG TPA: hypothetical protein PKH77_04955 [Anaerolineae bacterium]|nr:hypothetical protein [Anaerolineae bacterium]